MSELSNKFNSMNQHFWAQNIKTYIKNNKKKPLCQIILHAEKKFPPSMHQFLDDIFNIVVSKKWHLLGGNFFLYARRFGKLALFTIFML